MPKVNRRTLLKGSAPMLFSLSSIGRALVTPSNKTTKLAVVGRGLVGSAAARHLSKMGHEVVLVGPDEPKDYVHHNGVFASHYDEGRITRSFDAQEFWRDANRASISRYGEIASESGVDFYHEAGVLHIGPSGSNGVAQVKEVCDQAGIPIEAFHDEELAKRFPFLKSTAGMQGYFESHNAGYISARRLVRAQTAAAQHFGARIMAEPALEISETSSGIVVRTKSGNIEADRVLVAAGGYTQSLLGQSLGLTAYQRTVALFRLNPAEAHRLAGMPSMRCIETKDHDPYLLPPMPYPDGQIWIKIGANRVNVPLKNAAEINAWFKSGGSIEIADWVQQLMLERIKDLKFEERRVLPCMTTYGETGLPQIGPVSKRVSVVSGCYGKSAKCSDELGRLGAMAMLGEVRAELAPKVG